MPGDWTTPSFRDLPAVPGSDCRWVGTNLMDEEQYTTEGWQRLIKEVTDFSGEVPRTVLVEYWRLDVQGAIRYGALRRSRRDQRKRLWQEREREEQAYTDWVNTMPGVVR